MRSCAIGDRHDNNFVEHLKRYALACLIGILDFTEKKRSDAWFLWHSLFNTSLNKTVRPLGHENGESHIQIIVNKNTIRRGWNSVQVFVIVPEFRNNKIKRNYLLFRFELIYKLIVAGSRISSLSVSSRPLVEMKSFISS